MKKNGKIMTALLLVLAMLMSVATIGVSAADKRDANGYYAPDASTTKTRRVYFAMPGCWESNYWKTEGKEAAGAYWWSGEDTIPWLGYKMAKVTSEASVTNVYTTLLPCGGDNANQIIFNNFVDGLMPSMEGYTKERFDAAMNTVDATNSYHNIGDSKYYSKELWMYVYDKLAEFMEYPAIQWDAPDNPKFSRSELAQTKPLVAKVLTEYEGYTNEEFMEEFDIPEFGKYAKNFFFDFENQSGMALGFGDMMYVCNLDPYTLTVSYTIVPEGKTNFSGEYFFYYGNGEYGTWPTKELLKEKTGIEFVDGKVVAPETVTIDAYGNAVKTIPDANGNKITYMIAGTVNGAYATNKQLPEIPSDQAMPGIPQTSDDPTIISSEQAEDIYDAPDFTPSGNGNKLYFYVNPNLWKNYKTIYCYLYDHKDGEIITWGSKKGAMEDLGNNVWVFDLDAKGIILQNGHQYGCIFTADWGAQTCDLIVGTPCIGDVAYVTGNMVENNVDSNKKSYYARWKNANSMGYAPPLCINAIGNVIGEALWAGETPYTILVNFLKDRGRNGLDNAIKFNGKTQQQTIDEVANRLGLSTEDIAKAIAESGRGDIDWSENISTGRYDLITKNGFKLIELDDGTYMLADYSGSAEHVKIPSSVKVQANSVDTVGSSWEEPTEAPTTIPTTEPVTEYIEPTEGYGWYTEPATEWWYPEATIQPVTQPTTSYTPPTPVIHYIDVPVTAIGDWVFANNKYIQSVEIPDTIKTLGEGAFYNCVNLKSVDIPDSVTSIGTSVFEKCLNLEEAGLSNNLTYIGDEAFYDCRRLKTLDIPNSVTEIGEEAFTNCRSLTNLTIPKGVKKLGSEDSVGFGVFENCKNLQEITIPETVDYIQPNAFDGCKSVTLLGKNNSYAQQYAADNNLLFKAIQPDDSLVGDVSGDSRVDVTDATLVQMFAAEFTELNATQQKAADTNHDGKVDVTDATMIQMYAAEVIDHF